MPDPICRHCNDPQSEHAQRVWCRTTPNTCTFEPVERSKPEVEQELPKGRDMATVTTFDLDNAVKVRGMRT